jgi:hypothetical protein
MNRTRHDRGRQRGIAVVEMALILPIMLVMLFGIIEFGRIVLIRQVMINVSREAANLASRGTPLDEAILAVQMSSSPLDLGADGYVILTEVVRDGAGAARVRRQTASGAHPGGSRVGGVLGGLANLPATPTPIPPADGSLFVAEVFYHAETITPLGDLVGTFVNETFYDSAYF